jgi:NAD(P)-dependent dehydrogenase (short-subunit alcohol dehydrogenase family)
MSVVIVSGGTYGIGLAITLDLAQNGHDVIAFGLDSRQAISIAENGTQLVRAGAAERGVKVDVMEADCSKNADVARVVTFALEQFGRVDALVNNAAIGPLGTILETSEELWDRVIDVNLKGMFLTCKAVLPHMIASGGGSIVNIGSGAGWGKPNMFAYAASKGGVFALSAALGYDHFHEGIRVNTVVPGGGGLQTGMSLGRAQSELKKRTGQSGYTGTAAGRTARVEDIAAAVTFLLSPAAEVISGAVLDVGCFAGQGGPIPKTPARAKAESSV